MTPHAHTEGMTRSHHHDLDAIVEYLQPALAENASAHDRDGTFVHDSFELLAKARFFSAAVPLELGGGGARYEQLAHAVRKLAHACPSTALAASMHTHLVAAAVWKHLHGQSAEALLRRVASEGLKLVSTGAGDWVQSNGTVERVAGGYRVSGRKPFASGSMVADLAITSAPYEHPEQGWVVLHFAVPLKAEGVRVGTDWDTLGMRGTGSQTIELDRVFVPEAAISLVRPREGWHPAWSVVLTVAAPIYTAVYVGVAEAAREVALSMVRARHDVTTQILAGALENDVAMARTCWEAMVRNVNGYDFAPDPKRAGFALIHKTLVTNAVRRALDAALELAGGAAYFRRAGLERLFRDARGGGFHPLPEIRQQLFSGRLALGLEPI